MTLVALFWRVCVVVLCPEKCPEILAFSCPEKIYCAPGLLECTHHCIMTIVMRVLKYWYANSPMLCVRVCLPLDVEVPEGQPSDPQRG